jgi:hypothetical protein
MSRRGDASPIHGVRNDTLRLAAPFVLKADTLFPMRLNEIVLGMLAAWVLRRGGGAFGRKNAARRRRFR